MPYKEDIFSFGIHFSAMMLELIVFIFSFLIALIIVFKWRERRTIATLYLALALFSISGAVFVAFLGLFSWFLVWSSAIIPYVNSPVIYPISLPFAYSFVIIYDIFLFLFTIHIFLDKNEKKIIPVIIIGIFVATLLWLPTNNWGLDTTPMDPPSTRTISMLIYMLYNVVIYIILAFSAFRESKKTDQKEYQVGFQAIALGQIANILIFVFFLFDSVLLIINPNSPGFSIFIYLGWICALVAVFLFYIGFILPSWFRNRIKA
ncbi:MAG: hypothetical protein ACTSRG_14215 [Candidatus Helarchaeota archaeon]